MEISFTELNEIEKDILWIYANNTGSFNIAFVPEYSFRKKYWEYLNITLPEKNEFIQTGCLIIIIAMTKEYIDIPGGSRNIFQSTDLNIIYEYVSEFNAETILLQELKKIVLTGLEIALTIKEEHFAKNEDYQHSLLTDFMKSMNLVDVKVIKPYFKKLVEK